MITYKKRYKLICSVSLSLLFLSCTTSAEKRGAVELFASDTVSLALIEVEKVMTEEDIEKQKLKTVCELWMNENVNKDFLIGKVKRQGNPQFVTVDGKHTERNIYLIHPVYEAYKKMYEAALADGVKLRITSGHRTCIEQIIEWELRWNDPGTEIVFKNDVEKAKYLLQYRSMPGTTRHHWGTDIDLNSFELAYFETNEGQKVYNWLKENAGNFGFFQPYTVYDENRPTGYMEEKWHWSYKPLSQLMLRKYLELVTIDDIVGFKGDAAAKQLPIMSDWVRGINPQLYDED